MKHKNHELTATGWRRTSVAKKLRSHAAYRMAGIPEPIYSVDIAVLRAASVLDFGIVAKSETRPVFAWVRGSSLSLVRSYTLGYIARLAVDRGLHVRTIKLHDAIQCRFDRDEWADVRTGVREAKVLVFDLHHEGANKLIPQIVQEIVSARRDTNAVTLLVSSGDIRTLTGLYGPENCEAFKRVRCFHCKDGVQ